MYISPIITAYDSPHLSSKNTGLGNVLFQIASVYGLSKRYNRIANLSKVIMFGDKLKNTFGFNHKNTIFRNCTLLTFPVENDIVVHENSYKYRCERVVETIKNSSSNITLCGYLEYPLYFLNYKDDIINLFSPDISSFQYIQKKYPELFDDSRTPVSIHIRQGSDANTICSTKYYANAIRYIQDKVANPLFFIVSDAYIDMSMFDMNCIYVYGNEDYIDLWICSLCKHNITTYSTFSWWGSFLNKNTGKIITYPSSAIDHITSVNRVPKDLYHDEYFLGAVCIEDK